MLWEIWILLASIFSIISSVIAGLLVKYIQELLNKQKRINRLTTSQRALIILLIFIISITPKAFIDWQQSRKFKDFSATSISLENPTTSIAVREGITEQVYNENLLISMKTIECSYTTPRVRLIVGSIGFQEISLDDIEIGNVSFYKGENNYEIRLSSINCFLYCVHLPPVFS
ncbi:MAG: hypothetical protein ACFKPT_29520 [Gloeotrichia echinulata GP01]